MQVKKGLQPNHLPNQQPGHLLPVVVLQQNVNNSFNELVLLVAREATFNY